MKFNVARQFHGGEAEDNRWVSEDTQFTVRRYTYHKQYGVRSHAYVKPYYTVFHTSNKYRAVATHLHTWPEVIEACENFQGWPQLTKDEIFDE